MIMPLLPAAGDVPDLRAVVASRRMLPVAEFSLQQVPRLYSGDVIEKLSRFR